MGTHTIHENVQFLDSAGEPVFEGEGEGVATIHKNVLVLDSTGNDIDWDSILAGGGGGTPDDGSVTVAKFAAGLLDPDGTLAANSDAKIATQKAIVTYVAARIALLINSAPGALDTLKELADALGDDANFAATMTTALAGKQGLDATLTALAGVSTAANKLIYATGSDAFTTTDLSAFGRTLAALADYAALRTGAGLVIGTNVQAWDADLDTWAGKTPPSGAAVGTTDAQTLTNKRIPDRVLTNPSTPSAGAPAYAADSYDRVVFTALSGALNLSTNFTIGTPTHGQVLIFEFKDNGTTRAITWPSTIISRYATLPTGTTVSKNHQVVTQYDATAAKFVCLSASVEP